MKNKGIIYIILLSAVFAGGCRHTQELTREAEPAKPTSPAASCPASYGSATFTCTADGLQANGLIRTQCDSAIWISISKFIEVGRVLLTPDTITVYVRPLNCYYRNSYAHFQALSGIDLQFDRWQRLLWEKPNAAAAEMAQWGTLFGITLQSNIQPLKAADKLSFPMPTPSNPKPLELFLQQR